MRLIRTIRDLQTELAGIRGNKMTIGLVPTMGALHKGHASLINRSAKENNATVVSDFLNPTQFNDKKDLEKYPRTLDADCAIAEQAGADIVFAPSVDEMYPTPDRRHFSYPPIDTVMEGAYRPGHFNGVCQIVSKLFAITSPDRAYFGEKDYQQIAVVRAMVKALKMQVQIVACPVIREQSGLAMSSRNTLLSQKEREIAAHIYATLRNSQNYGKNHTLKETNTYVCNAINAVEGLKVQYFSIVDGLTLQELEDWEDSNNVVGCITVFCGKIPVRLIDHIRYKG